MRACCYLNLGKIQGSLITMIRFSSCTSTRHAVKRVCFLSTHNKTELTKLNKTTMPKKTQTYGSMRVIAKQTQWTYRYQGGSPPPQVSFRADRPAYSRRFGRTSIITSSSGIDGRFRPVTHTQETYTVRPMSALPTALLYKRLGTVSNGTIVEGWVHHFFDDLHEQYYGQFLTAVNSVSLNLGTVPWNALAETAVQTMLPSFAGQNSLVNFLLELKDFKSVFKYLATGMTRKLSRMNSFRYRNKSGVENIVHINLDKGKPLEWLSRRYLEYNFGWAPLFRDVVSLYESVRGFEAKFREMVRRELIPQQRYWGTTIAGTSSPSSTTFYKSDAGPRGGWIGPAAPRGRVRVEKEASPGIRYHATMRYRYKLPAELFGVGGKAKAFLDLLGVRRNPAVLWNAIPFSFIVDWVVNVNRYLERLSLDNIQVQTEILDFCHSAKVEGAVRLSLGGQHVFDNPHQVMDLAENITDLCVKRAYERRVGIPNFRAAILTSGLNLREFALGAALIGGKRSY